MGACIFKVERDKEDVPYCKEDKGKNDGIMNLIYRMTIIPLINVIYYDNFSFRFISAIFEGVIGIGEADCLIYKGYYRNEEETDEEETKYFLVRFTKLKFRINFTKPVNDGKINNF